MNRKWSKVPINSFETDCSVKAVSSDRYFIGKRSRKSKRLRNNFEQLYQFNVLANELSDRDRASSFNSERISRVVRGIRQRIALVAKGLIKRHYRKPL